MVFIISVYKIQVIQSIIDFVLEKINEMSVPIGIEKQWLQKYGLKNTCINKVRYIDFPKGKKITLLNEFLKHH